MNGTAKNGVVGIRTKDKGQRKRKSLTQETKRESTVAVEIPSCPGPISTVICAEPRKKVGPTKSLSSKQKTKAWQGGMAASEEWKVKSGQKGANSPSSSVSCPIFAHASAL